MATILGRFYVEWRDKKSDETFQESTEYRTHEAAQRRVDHQNERFEDLDGIRYSVVDASPEGSTI